MSDQLRRRRSLVLPQSRLPRRLPGPTGSTSLSARRAPPGSKAARTPAALEVHGFPEGSAFGRALARHLGCRYANIEVHRFPDRESLVRVRTPVAPHAIVVRSLDDPNPRLMECLLAADALRRAGARRVTLAAPYLPYMRQDCVFHPGEPISQRVFATTLRTAFDRVVTIEAHLHRIHSLAQIMPGQSLSAAPALADWVKRHAAGGFVVGPDVESTPWVKAIAHRAGVAWVVGSKQRLSDRRVRVTLPALPDRRHAVLVDDIASSGVTLASATRALRRQGIERIDALVVHAIFAPGALRRIHSAGVRRIVSCDTIRHPSNGIACAALLAAGLAHPPRAARRSTSGARP